MVASPKHPADMNWASLYPAYAVKEATQPGKNVEAATDASRVSSDEEQINAGAITQDVKIADIGCGFGGLLFALATTFPDTLSLGIVNLFLKPEGADSFPLQAWRYVSPSPNMFRRKYGL